MNKRLEWIARLTPVGVVAGVAAIIVLASSPASTPPEARQPQPEMAAERTTPKAIDGLVTKVRGARLVGSGDRPLQLRGVNRSGSEYACGQGWGIFDGPLYDAPNLTQPSSSIRAMKRWGINAVRIPLNEHCWLGINGVRSRYGGRAYRRAIGGYVDGLLARRMRVVLSLQVTGPGSKLNDGSVEYSLPSADHAPAFWRSVAKAYRSDRGVLFDLYNEPHLWELADGGDESSAAHWRCWRDGCNVPKPDRRSEYRGAGMQQLLNVVRATGARNVVLAGGLGYANNLNRFDAYAPRDPAHQLVASFHNYPKPLGACTTVGCWEKLPKRYATVTGEFGQRDCRSDYVTKFMRWSDRGGARSYFAWTWNATDNGYWNCKTGPSLLRHYDGTPSGYGAGVRAHFLARAKRSVK